MGKEVFIALPVIGVLLEVAVGFLKNKGYLWILVDEKGKYSLSRFQLALWTVLIVAALGAMAYKKGALDVKIPENVLLILGFSLGSAVGSQAIKSYKADKPRKDKKGTVIVAFPMVLTSPTRYRINQ